MEELRLTEHLAELRHRLLISLAAVSVAFAISYALIEPIFALFSRPLEAVLTEGSSLIFTSYPGAFFTYLKLALVTGIFLASPVILYQIWAFVAPGLYEHESRLALPFVVCSTIFFVGGAVFGYFVVFPSAFRFLASYTSDGLRLLPDVSQYFTLTVRLLLGFGLAFELPIFMAFLALVGIVNVRMLHRHRKYAILIVFVVAAILTPTPDIINLILMAGPLMVLYELSVLLVWLITFRREKGEA